MKKSGKNKKIVVIIISLLFLAIILMPLFFIKGQYKNETYLEDPNPSASQEPIIKPLQTQGTSSDLECRPTNYTSITINGDVDYVSHTEWYPSEYNYYSGIQDLDVAVMMDDDYLYVYVLAVDDDDDQTQDYAEIYFDTDHDATANPDIHDKKIRITDTTIIYWEGNGSTWASQSIPSNWTAVQGYQTPSQESEFKIPLSDLSTSGSFDESGDQIGFGVHIYDYNSPSTQDYHIWYPDAYDSNTVPTTAYHNIPSGWGDIEYSNYTAYANETTATITIDGVVNETAWQNDAWNYTTDLLNNMTIYTMMNDTYFYSAVIMLDDTVLETGDFMQNCFDTDHGGELFPFDEDYRYSINGANGTFARKGDGTSNWVTIPEPSGFIAKIGYTNNRVSYEMRVPLVNITSGLSFSLIGDEIGYLVMGTDAGDYTLQYPDYWGGSHDMRADPQCYADLQRNKDGDMILPEIANVSDTPDPQEYNQYVNITADVTDNMAVDTVWLNISGVGNYSMNAGSGDEYYYNTTYSTVGIYNYTIVANDTYDNWNSSTVHTFTIQDTTIPEIANVSDIPDPQEYNKYVNITVNITDYSAIDEVWVNITGIGNYSMNAGTGDEYYYNTTYSIIGTHNYTILANDTYDNWNTSATYNFTIQDTTKPQINNVSDLPDPQEYNQYVNITCNITDYSALDEVYVNVTYPNSTTTNTSMNLIWGSDDYFLNTTYDQLGVHDYFIWTNDTYNNWNMSLVYNFTIRDTTLAGIYNATATPDPQGIGKYVNVTADVNDYAVDSVWLNVTLPNATYQNTSMVQGVGDEWYYNTTYGQLGVHSYIIWVNDTSDNWNSSSVNTFTIIDDILPEITNVTDIPDPQEFGSNVNITVDVTDNIAVDTVWVNISGIGNYSMIAGSGDEYYYIDAYSILGTFDYVIWANDTSDNWNGSATYNFTIHDTTLPVISDLVAEPYIQTVEDYVNITCNVTDNVAVFGVWVNITYPNSTYQNVSMVQGSGDQWYFNQTYGVTGTFNYMVWANDTSNNWANTTSEIFKVQLSLYDFVASIILTLGIVLAGIIIVTKILFGDKGGYYKKQWGK